MRIIRNLDKDISIDEFGNFYSTEGIFALFEKMVIFLKSAPSRTSRLKRILIRTLM